MSSAIHEEVGVAVADEQPDAKWVQVADNRWRRVTRRDLIKYTVAGAAAASMSSFGIPQCSWRSSAA